MFCIVVIYNCNLSYFIRWLVVPDDWQIILILGLTAINIFDLNVGILEFKEYLNIWQQINIVDLTAIFVI